MITFLSVFLLLGSDDYNERKYAIDILSQNPVAYLPYLQYTILSKDLEVSRNSEFIINLWAQQLTLPKHSIADLDFEDNNLHQLLLEFEARTSMQHSWINENINNLLYHKLLTDYHWTYSEIERLNNICCSRLRRPYTSGNIEGIMSEKELNSELKKLIK